MCSNNYGCVPDATRVAYALPKEAVRLPQDEVPVDMRTVTKAVRRERKLWCVSRPEGLFSRIMKGTLPRPLVGVTRDSAVDVHQVRAGHWAYSQQYLHRIGRRPAPACQ